MSRAFPLALLAAALLAGCQQDPSPKPSPDFSLSVPARLEVTLGGEASLEVGVSGSGVATIQLGLATPDGSALPAGLSGSFSPNPVRAGDGQSLLRLSAQAPLAPGSYALRVKGVAGDLSRHGDFTLVVSAAPPPPSFGLSVDPALEITAGQKVSAGVEISGSGVPSITLSLEKADGGALPQGITAAFDPNPASTAQGQSTLEITAAADLPAGDYSLRVKGVGGGITRTAPLKLTVKAPAGCPAGDFCLELPAPLEVPRGQYRVFTVKVLGSGVSGIELRLERADGGPLPSFLSPVFDPETVNAGGQSLLVVYAEPSGSPQDVALRVRAVGGGKTKTYPLTLRVRAAKVCDYEHDESCAARLGPDLLTNGGFEEVDAYGPVGWDGTSKPQVHLETGGAHSGTRAIRINGNLSDGDYFHQTSPALKAATTYRLSGWIKTEGFVDSKINAWYNFANLRYVVLSPSKMTYNLHAEYDPRHISFSTNGWQYFYRDFTTPPDFAGGNRIDVHYNVNNGAQTVWFDDIKLQEVLAYDNP